MIQSHYCPECDRIHAGFTWTRSGLKCRYCGNSYDVTAMGLHLISTQTNNKRFNNLIKM